MPGHNGAVHGDAVTGARRRLAGWAVAAVVLVAFVLVAPRLVPYDPVAVDLASAGLAPCLAHPLGCDALGRDVACRVVVGTRTSLLAALAVTAMSFAIGAAVGAISGYLGGAVDAVLMRVTDAFMAFPALVLSIAVAGVLGGGMVNAVIALTVPGWTRFARLARSQVLAVKGRTFVQAERLSGLSRPMVALRHVLPNVLPALVVTAALSVGGRMLDLAGLSFLGLGASPPAPELGAMINQAAPTFAQEPWAVFGPGAAILVVVVVLNLLGDAANDLLGLDASWGGGWVRHLLGRRARSEASGEPGEGPRAGEA